MKLIAPHADTRVSSPYQYTAKPLLTESEAKLLVCLVTLSRGMCMIACKPRLADFVQHYERGGFNKISQKHVDFLIYRMEDGMPMMGIELDDPSHEAADRKKRDAEVNTLFAQIGIPLVRIHVSEMEKVEQLVGHLDRAWVRRTETLSQYHGDHTERAART